MPDREDGADTESDSNEGAGRRELLKKILSGGGTVGWINLFEDVRGEIVSYVLNRVGKAVNSMLSRGSESEYRETGMDSTTKTISGTLEAGESVKYEYDGFCQIVAPEGLEVSSDYPFERVYPSGESEIVYPDE